MEAPAPDGLSFEQVSTCGLTTKPPTTERKRDYLCDLTLLVKDGKQFRAHRDLLSEASPFFEKLLKSSMKERKEGVVRLEVLTEPLMEDILQFIYTGDVQISTRERAEDLITAADYLCVLPLKTVPGRFLELELTTANCISTHFFAETYHCEELLTNSRKFIHENIVEVSKSEDFLNLERQEIERWISSDDIAVTAEEDVFDMILRWIDHDKSHRMEEFNELFSHLRLVFISRDYLSRHVVTNQLVKENVSCLDLVLNTVKWIDGANNDGLPHRPRKAMEVDALVANRQGAIWFYVPDEGKWFQFPNLFPAHCDVVSCQGRLFAFSRDDMLEVYRCYNRLDPFFKRWTARLIWTPPPTEPTESAFDKVLVIREEIYVTVTDYRKLENNSLYRYDIQSDSWKIISSFHLNDEACLVVDDQCVYALGGLTDMMETAPDECVAKAKRFDTTKKKWEKIAELQQARRSAFGVAAHGKIFVAGGWGGTHVWAASETCEMYNKLTNEWQFIASLTAPRVGGSMMCVGETLYVLGGVGRNMAIVECYNLEKREWQQATILPHKKVRREPCRCCQWTVTQTKGCSTKLLRPVVDQLQLAGKRRWLPRFMRKRN